jgi:hypothetical protein
MKSTTHVAGLPMDICGRIIQRCAVCGEKMCDSLNAAMPISDGIADEFPTWQVGAVVRVTFGQPEQWTLLTSGERMPLDACARTMDT